MIKTIYIKNFKSFKEQKIELANLNLLTGVNGMGKSTLIQAMLLLRQSYMKDAKKIYLSDISNIINLGVAKEVLCWEREADDNTFSIAIHTEKRIFEIKAGLAKNNSLDSDVLSILQGGFSYAKTLPLFTENFQYLCADRISPEMSFVLSEQAVRSKNLGKKGEYTAHYLLEYGGKNIGIPTLCHETEKTEAKPNLSLIYQTEKWLSEISPNIKLDIKKIGTTIDIEYYGKDFRAENATLPHRRRIHEGFGITYVLPIIVALLSAKVGDLLLIENPESHLHPRGQTKLAELIALAAQAGVQILLETHSDHIFYGIRVAAKHKKIEADKINTYYFSKKNNMPLADIQAIKINQRGELNIEPSGFFDDYEMNLLQLI